MRFRKSITAVLIGALLLVLAATAGFDLLRVARDLRRADTLLSDAADQLKEGELQRARSSLAEAQDLVLQANESMRSSIPLDIIGFIPIASQNLAGIQDSVNMVAKLVHGGSRILDAAKTLEGPDGTLEVSLTEGAVPLGAVTTASREIANLTAQLEPWKLKGGSRWLLPPVEELKETVATEAEDRRAQLEVLGEGLRLVQEMVGGSGSRRYLIAVANTAEMRGSGGMVLNYGVLEGSEGSLDLTNFGRVDELALSAPVPDSIVPADYLARWRGFEPLTRMRQANLSGDFTVVAPVLEAIYTEATGLPVNGVIQVDPQGLAAILAGVGPVQVPEVGVVTAENVVQLTLHDAYFLFPDVETRSDVLGDVAEAAFTRLVEGDFPSLRPLAENVARAVSGNHIMMHATSRQAKGSITAFGADGAYPDLETIDSFGLTAQNLAGNKLDWYLDTDVSLTGERPSDSLGEIDAKVTLTNTAPAGADDPAYIYGPGMGGLPAGVMRSVVTLYLPLGTSLLESGGDALVEPISSGTEAGRPYVSFLIDVPAASARTVDLKLRVPPRATDEPELRLVASPRLRPTTVSVDVGTDGGRFQGDVSLDRSWSLIPGRPPQEVVAPVYK